MVNRVGCYLRVSTRESAENGWSIGGQYGEIRNWVSRTHERKGKQREVGIEPASYLVALGVLCRAYDEKQIFDLYNQLFDKSQADEVIK